jgi:hypothetical protein
MFEKKIMHPHNYTWEIFIFCISLLVFNWPLMHIAGEAGPLYLLLYLFSAWLLLIILIALTAFFRREENGFSDMPENSENFRMDKTRMDKTRMDKTGNPGHGDDIFRKGMEEMRHIPAQGKPEGDFSDHV